jgi:hypothetical protein
MNISEARLKQIIKEEIQKHYVEIDDVLLEQLLEESKIMQAIAAGGLAALIALQVIVNNDNEEFRNKMIAQAEAAAETKSDRALEDLQKLVDSPVAWQWSDSKDPDDTTQFPKLDFENANDALKNITVKGKSPGGFSVLPPGWTIANKVLKDKKEGKINVPGMAPGEEPTYEEIVTVLKKLERPQKPTTDQTTFIADYGDYLTPTSDHGSKLVAIGGQIDLVNGVPVQRPAVAIDADFLSANPNMVLYDTGKSVKDEYIKRFYGDLMDADDVEHIVSTIKK